MYQICVSGAAKGETVELARDQAAAVGRAIAEAGHTLMTGATVGLPNYAALAYKAAGGKMSVGISPAASKIEHVMKYRLPTESYDVILYTGLHYIGRDTLLVTSSDAVVSIGGRLGTLHEFTVAMETRIPIGFMEGTGGVSEHIRQILEAAEEASNEHVSFDTDAVALVERIVGQLDERRHEYYIERTERYISTIAKRQAGASRVPGVQG